MKILRQLVKRIKDARGAATSLVEAALTISVGAALAAAALAGGLDATTSANFASAKEQSTHFSKAINSFYTDVHVLPGWKQGNDTGPTTVGVYDTLVSEQGTYPIRGTASGLGWPTLAAHSAYPPATLTGEQVDANSDSIENHLDRNGIGFNPLTSTISLSGGATSYSVGVFTAGVSGVTGAPYPGHKGNYLKQYTTTAAFDPWYHKWLMNARVVSQALDQGRFPASIGGVASVASTVHCLAFFVMTAGPDGVVDTPELQGCDVFTAFNDDIATKLYDVKF